MCAFFKNMNLTGIFVSQVVSDFDVRIRFLASPSPTLVPRPSLSSLKPQGHWNLAARLVQIYATCRMAYINLGDQISKGAPGSQWSYFIHNNFTKNIVI